MNKMKLYISEGSCSDVIVILADKLGITLELIIMRFATEISDDGMTIEKVSPKGYVPALHLENGEIITEVIAISAYLASLVKEQTLFPMTNLLFIRHLEWMNYIATELHKSYQPFFRKMFEQSICEEWLHVGKENLTAHFTYIEAHLNQNANTFLLGREVTVADIYLYIMLRWSLAVKFDMRMFPILRDYQKRMKRFVRS